MKNEFAIFCLARTFPVAMPMPSAEMGAFRPSLIFYGRDFRAGICNPAELSADRRAHVVVMYPIRWEQAQSLFRFHRLGAVPAVAGLAIGRDIRFGRAEIEDEI